MKINRISLSNLLMVLALASTFMEFYFSNILHSNYNNLLSIICMALAVVFQNNYRIKDKVLIILVIFSFFSITSLISGFVQGLVSSYGIIYTLYKILELILLSIFISNVSRISISKINFWLRNLFIFVNLPLFIYYLLVLLGVFNFYNRTVVFIGPILRFGGFIGEPRDFAISALTFLFLSFYFVRKRRITRIAERIIICIMAISTYSNALIISLFFAICIYLILKKKYIILFDAMLILLISLYLFNISFFRFSLDLPFIKSLIFNFSGTPQPHPTQGNPLNIRLYYFVDRLTWLKDNIFGSGLGTDYDLALTQGKISPIIGRSVGTGLIGFTKFCYELGVFAFISFVIWAIILVKRVLSTKNIPLIVFLSFTLFNIFIITGFYSKINWFFILIIFLYGDVKKINRSQF